MEQNTETLPEYVYYPYRANDGPKYMCLLKCKVIGSSKIKYGRTMLDRYRISDIEFILAGVEIDKQKFISSKLNVIPVQDSFINKEDAYKAIKTHFDKFAALQELHAGVTYRDMLYYINKHKEIVDQQIEAAIWEAPKL